MTYRLVEDRSNKGQEMRLAIVGALQDLMGQDDKVVAMDADLATASAFARIRESNPDRFIECGIAEANMIGTAAGLSMMGFKPFVHSFAPFVTRRVLDQVFLEGAYAYNTINIWGSDPGFCVAQNGGTHTVWGDVGVMSEIPGCVICDPADAVQFDWIVRQFAQMDGVHYVRANRKPVREVYQPGSTFEMGKGNVLRDGEDVLIITEGQLVSDALDAAKSLAEKGISCEVVDMFCIKPLDKELVLSEAAGKSAVVTFENHSIVGGLGSAVAAVLAEANVDVKFRRHGVNERFGQVGTAVWLQAEYKLTAADLEKTVEEIYHAA